MIYMKTHAFGLTPTCCSDKVDGELTTKEWTDMEKQEINMNEVRTIKIKDTGLSYNPTREITLEEYRELWKWHKNQFLKLSIYGDDYSTTLFTEFDEIVDKLIVNKFNAVATNQKGVD